MELIERGTNHDEGDHSRGLVIGGRRVDARLLAIPAHEAAFILGLTCGGVDRLLGTGRLAPAAIDDPTLVEVRSLARLTEHLVAIGELDQMSLVLLRDLVAGQRRIPMEVGLLRLLPPSAVRRRRQGRDRWTTLESHPPMARFRHALPAQGPP
jgi:hypothetical protein